MVEITREQAAPAAGDRVRRLRWGRIITAGAGMGSLLFETAGALSEINGAMADPDTSAVQIIQLWMPHVYTAVVIIGIMVACYILTRAVDTH